MRFAATVPVVVALVLFAPPGVAAAELDGTWVLVEQTYGEGAANLIQPERVLRLRVGAAEAPDLVRVEVVEAGETKEVRWPAFGLAADGRTADAEVLTREVDAAAGELHARYRVRPNPEDPLVLEVTEDYVLDPATGRLAGPLRVRFLLDGEPRGSYVLHRTFERAGR